MKRLAVLALWCLLLSACAGSGDDGRAAQTGGSATSEPGAAETGPAEPGPAGPEGTGTGPAATEPSGTEPSGTEPEAEPDSGATSSTPEALDFEAALVGGGTFRGSDHDGRDVALWFWAPW